MDTEFIFAQICGTIGFLISVITMQINDKKKIVMCMIGVNIFYALNFIFLKAWAGALICGIAIIEAVINNYFNAKEKNIPKYIIASYVIIAIITGIITYEKIFDVLPIVASLTYVLVISVKREKTIRKISLVNDGSWIIYDLIVGSYAAGISDIFLALSTIIGIYRYDIKTKEKINE